jgi:hypothetical protein
MIRSKIVDFCYTQRPARFALDQPAKDEVAAHRPELAEAKAFTAN